MNKRSLRAREADLSSRRAVEDAIEIAKNDQDLTWEEAAKRARGTAVKWGRLRRRSASDEKQRTSSLIDRSP
jgi:hypothetical protein